MKVAVIEILKNPENYKQCIACKNPLSKDKESCIHCGSEYFEPSNEVDFEHLREIKDLNQLIII